VKKFNKRSKLSSDEQKKFKLELDLLNWMEIFDPFKLKSVESFVISNRISVQDNLKKLHQSFSKRDFANYILWRVVDFSIQFLGDEIQGKILKLYRQTFGVLDKEQRWKLCTRMTNIYAELASGSLYIQEYFPEESRAKATEMANEIIEEFKRTIKDSEWMETETKEKALETVNNLKMFMGYDEKLLDIREVEKYYGKPYRDFSSSFYYLGLQLNVQTADKAFKHKYRKEPDWTEYAKPTTSRARYNKNDNSVCMKVSLDFRVHNFIIHVQSL
jgi:predicted metalloendopeptidase